MFIMSWASKKILVGDVGIPGNEKTIKKEKWIFLYWHIMYNSLILLKKKPKLGKV